MKQVWFFTVDKVGKPRGGNNNDSYDDDNNNYIPEEPLRRHEQREHRANLREAVEGAHQGHPRLPVVRQGAGHRPRGHQAAQNVGGTLPYMAPELLLGYDVTCAADMWGLGCTLAELATGKVLFDSPAVEEHLPCCIEILGMPPKKMVDDAPNRTLFFDSEGLPDNLSKQRPPGSLPLHRALQGHHPQLVDFVSRCLQWDPNLRMTPEQALAHSWLQTTTTTTRATTSRATPTTSRATPTTSRATPIASEATTIRATTTIQATTTTILAITTTRATTTTSEATPTTATTTPIIIYIWPINWATINIRATTTSWVDTIIWATTTISGGTIPVQGSAAAEPRAEPEEKLPSLSSSLPSSSSSVTQTFGERTEVVEVVETQEEDDDNEEEDKEEKEEEEEEGERERGVLARVGRALRSLRSLFSRLLLCGGRPTAE
ncbi:unnamed protein product [Lampetra planeri]